MKRSGQVGLVVMGAATFVATFGSVYAYRAGSTIAQRPSDCAPRADVAQNCQPAQRSFVHYFYPGYFHAANVGSADPRARSAPLTNSSRTAMPAANTGVVRSGFGATGGSGSFRVSAGG
jgi:hypothetical protein